jgi:hypothetical protein
MKIITNDIIIVIFFSEKFLRDITYSIPERL